jgi:hypothetical protein
MRNLEEAMMKSVIRLVASICAGFLVGSTALATEQVTVDNFVRAETDEVFSRYVKQGGFGEFSHERNPVSIDKQNVTRMNRDTLYSIGIFDLTEPVTIVKPNSGKRYQSMMVLDQDQYVVLIAYSEGEHILTKDQVGTRYACVIIRTFIDANDPTDIKAAHTLQDRIMVRQKNVGKFAVPAWDGTMLKKIRDALNVLAATRDSTKGMFGGKGKVDFFSHLLGTAYGWGGLPASAATYENVVPQLNDGQTAYALSVKNVPVDGFWSITVYGKDGFMVKNDQNRYSYNDVTAEKNPDGSITINFGGGPDAINNLPITPGWNYIVRMYQPRKEIIEGSWKFPEAKPTE